MKLRLTDGVSLMTFTIGGAEAELVRGSGKPVSKAREIVVKRDKECYSHLYPVGPHSGPALEGL